MKTLTTLICTANLVWLACAQAQNSSSLTTGTSGTVPGSTTDSLARFQVVERGEHHKVHQRMEWETTRSGLRIPHVHKVTELATGMHYRDPVTGRWRESSERVQLLPDGRGASATEGPCKVHFPADIYSGALVVVGPDGTRQTSRPSCISYFDGTRNVLIAELTNSIGQILPSGNQVIYTNCFTDIEADFLVTFRKSMIECDVVIRAPLPSPSEFSMEPSRCRVQVLTEFIDTQTPVIESRATSAEDGLADARLRFGSTMRMVRGRALAVERRDRVAPPSRRINDPKAIPIYKSWQKFGNRAFLLEEAPYRRVRALLDGLALSGGASRVYARTAPRTPGLERILTPERAVADTGSGMLLARNSYDERSGLVWDYRQTPSQVEELVFQGDGNYLISDNVEAQTLTIEGNPVVKFSTDLGSFPSLVVYGQIECQTSPYRMAIFTSADDNSVGEAIGTGVPSSGNGVYLEIDGGRPGIDQKLQYIRMSYAGLGVISYAEEDDLLIEHSQFVNCADAVSLFPGGMAPRNLQVHNTLFANCSYPIKTSSAEVSIENVTADQFLSFSQFDGGNNQLGIANSILTGGGALVSGGAAPTPWIHHTSIEPTGLGVFASVAGGAYYLREGSTNRGAATTNITPSLLAALRKQTTHPPVVFSNITISANTNFLPRPIRDTASSPDRGYH